MCACDHGFDVMAMPCVMCDVLLRFLRNFFPSWHRSLCLCFSIFIYNIRILLTLEICWNFYWWFHSNGREIRQDRERERESMSATLLRHLLNKMLCLNQDGFNGFIRFDSFHLVNFYSIKLRHGYNIECIQNLFYFKGTERR